MFRVDGALVPLKDGKRLPPEEIARMALRDHERVPEGEVQADQRGRPRLRRARAWAASASTSSSSAAPSASVLRVIPFKIQIDRAAHAAQGRSRRSPLEERGLILVTGTTGSGKSTTLAAMIDHINATETCHIMTIEDPIEFLIRDKRSIVNQREVGVDTMSLRPGAEERAAPGPGRHPGRRNARPRDHRDGAHRRRDRPPGDVHAAHPRRHRDHQPHHLGLPAVPAEAGAPAARRRCCRAVISPAPGARAPTARAACRGRGAARPPPASAS